MVYTCEAAECYSHTSKLKNPEKYPWMKDVRWVKFPRKDEAALARWKRLIRRGGKYKGKKVVDKFNVNKRSRLCSRHFDEDNIDMWGNSSADPKYFAWNDWGIGLAQSKQEPELQLVEDVPHHEEREIGAEVEVGPMKKPSIVEYMIPPFSPSVETPQPLGHDYLHTVPPPVKDATVNFYTGLHSRILQGKPNQTNPACSDYMPSLFKHKQNGDAGRKMELYNIAAKRGQISGSTCVIDQAADAVCTSRSQYKLSYSSAPVSDTERSMLYQEMDALQAERDAALKQLKVTEEQLRQASLTAGSVKDNDARCKQNTGLSWIVFLTTFNFLETFVSKNKHTAMASIDQFFITLLKLRTGTTFDFIACHTNVSETCIFEIFWKWIDTMYTNLSFVICSPDPEAVRLTLPHVFKKCYPRLTCIVDCFELFIDLPTNLKARAQIYSNYNTVKIFIGCTPLGAISFISIAWGGIVSDLELVGNSGFINQNLHTPGDQILVDRAFPFLEDIAIHLGVEFIIPAFTKHKKRLSAKEAEVSSVRIHIERIIGVLKNRYTILQGELPITMIESVEDESMGMKIARIDKMVHVCACLVNLGDGIA